MSHRLSVPLHPLHALLIIFPFPLFLGALISDFAYWGTYHIQWANFSSWLIAGGLVGNGIALLWALVRLIRLRRSPGFRRTVYLAVLLLVTWITGFLNALIHAKDAWATMPEGLYLSIAITVLSVAAAWAGGSNSRSEVVA